MTSAAYVGMISAVCAGMTAVQTQRQVLMQTETHKLQNVLNTIRTFESKYDRPAFSVTLVAASKQQSTEKMLSVYQCGQKHFAENYLQEALPKQEALTASNIEWHFIGKVQRNKSRKLAERFAWVQSVDHIHLAERLNEQRPDVLPPLNICIEVNIGDEENKSGIKPSDVLSLATQIQTLPRLRLRGLMSIPPYTENFAEQRHFFHQLHEIYEECRKKGLDFDTLSMGMSHDLEAAIAEGATMVRVGTGIFGTRLA